MPNLTCHYCNHPINNAPTLYLTPFRTWSCVPCYKTNIIEPKLAQARLTQRELVAV